MYASVLSASLRGIEAEIIQVEVHLDTALPAYTTVGLPDSAVKESKERVSAAIRNSGFVFPAKKVTVNLAPADVRKEGASFDLPIALGILASTGQLSTERLKGTAILGELALDGTLRPIRGALSISGSLPPQEIERIILPAENAPEASIASHFDVIPVKNLSETVAFLNGELEIAPVTVDLENLYNEETRRYPIDFGDVRGQESAKRALEIAAAGGHNVLMIGPPGSGKTMLAKRMPSILPLLSIEEALDTTKIYSVAGMLPSNVPLMLNRPFRSPHHTVSDVGLIGGGQIPRPGEVSLAHQGVLFLDELPEFNKYALEALRQPMEDGDVTITRTKSTITYPANFTLIAAMNPCPCGYYGQTGRECRCSVTQVQKYMYHVSGPLLDRIDIHIEVPAVNYNELHSTVAVESAETIRARVEAARRIQTERFGHYKGINVNADMRSREIRKYCKVSNDSANLLKQAMNSQGLSARGHDRILKVSRTIADLAGAQDIQPDHIAEAIQYRTLDRERWA